MLKSNLYNKADKQKSLGAGEDTYFLQMPIDILPFFVLHLICQTTLHSAAGMYRRKVTI
jgi:hypothetical protein